MRRNRHFGEISMMFCFCFLIFFVFYGCSGCGSKQDDSEYEAEKMYMISSLDQKDNFSKLLYQNLETVGGTKYTLIRNMSNGIVTYQRSSGGIDFFNSGLEKTGEPHLTSSRGLVYVMYENGIKLARLDYEKNSAIAIEFEEPQTDISIAAVEDGVYLYSKESGFLRYCKDFEEHERIGEKQIKEMEGRSGKLFLNKSSRGLMIMGDEFRSIFFLRKGDGSEVILNRMRLKGYDKIIRKPRVVEYDKKYYIKPGNEDFVLEFDYTGNFIEKRKMPDEE